VGIAEDITDQYRMLEELEIDKTAAEAASRANGEFLANRSYEMRTPMNGIIGMTDLVLDTELTPEQAEYLQTVKTSADSLLTIINVILDFWKIEAGKLEMCAVNFDLRKSLEELMKVGLAISNRLVQLLGGRIWVESEGGHGSTFHFSVRLELGS
jgi:two-component system sensor histidine kinase/response regulator